MIGRSYLLDVARACIGTLEGSSRHKTIIDIYNSSPDRLRKYDITPNDAWCAAFVSSCFIAAGLHRLIPIDCSCFYFKNEASKRGQLRDKNRYIPRAGDIILYKWAGKNVPGHIGIIEDVTGSKLTVIEGNYNNSVGRRKISLSYQYIDSYVEVKYPGE